MKYTHIDGVEYKRPQDVADSLCESNMFTPEEKKCIQNEVKNYPELVESRTTIFAEWFFLLDERIGN